METTIITMATVTTMAMAMAITTTLITIHYP